MTPEQIQQLRTQFNYNPASLKLDATTAPSDDVTSKRLRTVLGEETATPEAKQTFLDRVSASAKKTGEEYQKTKTEAELRQEAGQQGGLSTGFQTGAAAAKAGVGTVLAPVKVVAEDVFGGIGDLISKGREAQKQADLQAIQAGTLKPEDALSNKPYFEDQLKSLATNLMQKLQPTKEEFDKLSPEVKANLEAIGNLAGAGFDVATTLGGGKVIKEGAGKLLTKAAEEAPAVIAKTKSLFIPTDEMLKTKVVEAFNKGVKPLLSGKKNMGDLKAYEGKVVEAVNTIKNNKDTLQYTDELGDVISGQSPKSLQQFADAIDQTKTNIFKQYDELAKKAGGKGLKVNTLELSKELDSVINNKALSITNPSAIDYASELQTRLKGLKEINPDTAQEVIKNYNKQLESFYKNPTYDAASRVAIDALVANKFRSYLDDGISKLTGDSYQSLKNTYGALSTVEKDVVRAALRDARKNVKGLIDFGDILSGGQVASGILTMNPTTIATGAIQKGIQEFIKYKNNPNRLIESMFKKAEKISQTNQSPKKILLQTNPTATPINAQSNITNISETIPQKVKAATKVVEKKMSGFAQITKDIPKELQPLAEEARKYKSAEEFVKAQSSLFRGVESRPAANRIREGATPEYTGVAFSREKSSAQKYGDLLMNKYIPESMILKPSDVTPRTLKMLRGDFNKLPVGDADSVPTEILISRVMSQAKQKGKAGADIAKFFPKMKEEKEVRLFGNVEVTYSKSQLIDLWNKANGKN